MGGVPASSILDLRRAPSSARQDTERNHSILTKLAVLDFALFR